MSKAMAILLMMSAAAWAQGGDAAPSARERADLPKAADLFAESDGSLIEASARAAAKRHGVEYDGMTAKNASLFAVPRPEPKVLKKHDLVTIIIREQSESSSEATSDLKKEAALEAKVEEWIKMNWKDLKFTGGGVSSPIPSVKMSGNRDFKGEATVERTDSFIGRIQAEVVDVKPNGTFVLQARKRIRNDEETQEFVLSGICRAQDLTGDNSILSTQIYNLELIKNTTGDVRKTTKKGIVPRLVDFVNPF